MKRILKARFFLVVPYVTITLFLLGHAIFSPDYTLFSLGLSDMLLLLATTPWMLLFAALIDFFALEGNLIANIALFASVAINASIFYCVGRLFEHAVEQIVGRERRPRVSQLDSSGGA
jgi:hypothetical protein